MKMSKAATEMMKTFFEGKARAFANYELGNLNEQYLRQWMQFEINHFCESEVIRNMMYSIMDSVDWQSVVDSVRQRMDEVKEEAK